MRGDEHGHAPPSESGDGGCSYTPFLPATQPPKPIRPQPIAIRTNGATAASPAATPTLIAIAAHSVPVPPLLYLLLTEDGALRVGQLTEPLPGELKSRT
jgi:hypothetical protein